jgi:tetratricopeptide (TPR) repeat protein
MNDHSNFGLIVAAALLCSSLARAQESPGAADPVLRAAEQALDDRVPEVAIQKLDTFLTSSAALDDALRERAESDLTRAMLDSGDAVGALARLEFPADETQRFWKAEALSALGRWDDAEPLYTEVASDGPAGLEEPAAIGEAEALHALGRTPEAITVLASLKSHSPSPLVRLRLAEMYIENQQVNAARKLLAGVKPATLIEKRWRQYVEGRLYLANGEAAPALDDFDTLLKDPRGLTAALHAGATIGLTEARIIVNGLEVADNVIEAYISHNPESPYLDDMFRRLDAIYAEEENPSDTELDRWTGKGPPRRAALALFYAARSLQRQGRFDKAIERYTAFTDRFPRHPLAFEAWMQVGQLYLSTGRVSTASFDGAMRSSGSPAERARAEIAAGAAHFMLSDFLVAAELFRDAAQRSAAYWEQARYDSALSWLHVGNYDRFLEDYNSLGHDQRRDLLLEEGLLQAQNGDARAPDTLDSFIHDFPDNRRIPEARLALAELKFAAGDMDTASTYLKAAYDAAPSQQSREQADYLGIFIADAASDRSDDNVLSLGRQFLNAYPSSSLRGQVRMKMGQVYFRREDYANAQTQFETLVQENPADPLSDQALILAGQSAVRSMSSDGAQHALDLYDRVAKGSGPLKLYARQEEALVEFNRGHSKEAVIIYDDILRLNPNTQLRLAALCGKADCLTTPESDTVASPSPAPSPAASGTSRDAYAMAVSLYDQVATDPDAAGHWRDEALYKKAHCLSKQGLADQALSALYDVLSGRPATSKEEPDFVWYEKAGFEAAALLESRAQWPGAISVMEKVAQAGGPRSTEARKRADQLRLDHFIWD